MKRIRRLMRSPFPLTYYHANSGIAQVINAMREKKPGALRFAVIGLGTGSIACHAREGDIWNFYEIDQSIVDVATNPGYFTFLPSCAPDAKIVRGDARLTLTDAKDGVFTSSSSMHLPPMRSPFTY